MPSTSAVIRACGPRYAMVGGCRYEDRWEMLLAAALEWRRCARDTLRSAKRDIDRSYRILGARAVRKRRAVAWALARRALNRFRREHPADSRSDRGKWNRMVLSRRGDARTA